MRFASNLVNSKTDGDVEDEHQFLIRLVAQGLYIEGVDEYVEDTRTLTIGGYKDIVLSSAESKILDEIGKLPTVEQYPEMKHMTLLIKITAANEQVTIPISNMTDFKIDWGNDVITETNGDTTFNPLSTSKLLKNMRFHSKIML